MPLRRLAVLASAVALTAAGCGSSGASSGIASLEDASTTSTVTGTTVDREQAMLDFTQCMRDHGVDMPDPTLDAEGNLQMVRPSGGGEGGEFDPADREATRAARQACSQYLQDAMQGFDRPDMTQVQDQMLQYAACMRENGVDMPDPDFTDDQGDRGPGARLGFGSGDFDPSDPAFQAANETCRDIFGATGMPGFLGGGPGGHPPEEGDTPPPTDG